MGLNQVGVEGQKRGWVQKEEWKVAAGLAPGAGMDRSWQLPRRMQLARREGQGVERLREAEIQVPHEKGIQVRV